MKTKHITRIGEKRPVFEPLPKPAVYYEFNHRRELVRVEKAA